MSYNLLDLVLGRLKKFTPCWLRKMVWVVELCMRHSAEWPLLNFPSPITLPVHIICYRHNEVMPRRPSLVENESLDWRSEMIPSAASDGDLFCRLLSLIYIDKISVLFCCWKSMSWGSMNGKRFKIHMSTWVDILTDIEMCESWGLDRHTCSYSNCGAKGKVHALPQHTANLHSNKNRWASQIWMMRSHWQL